MASKQVAQDNGGRNAMWFFPETTGLDPPERWGHSACFSEGTLYIFGGCCGGLHFSDVLTLDLKTMSWSTLVATGQQPGTRDSHSAVLVGHNMIIFGGTNGSKKINDVYILDLIARSWSHPTVKGDPPAPRESHSATLVGDNKVVIFGGSGEGDGNYLNDVHILHLDTMEWTSPEVKGDLPACRDSHTAVAVGNQLVVYGGDCGDRYLGELDILDLQTLTWSKLEMAGSIQPGVRAGHAAVTVGYKVYIFGGVGDRAYYNDIWMLDINACSWTILDVGGPQPQGRFSHVAVLAENNIAIYGGCGEDERPLNEFMVLCLQVDELSEDSPLRRFAKSHHGLPGRRGHGGLKGSLEANSHENGGCSSDSKYEDNGKDNLKLIDLMGGNSGHVGKLKEFLKSSKRNSLDMQAESRVPSSQGSCPLSIPSLINSENGHSQGLGTLSNASALRKDSYSVLQRRIRSRKVPLPYIEQLIGQTPDINHAELKRRKTSHLICKLEGVDSEPDDHSPTSQHSSPAQSDPEQLGQRLHCTMTNSKSLKPQFAMFLPQQSAGPPAHPKYQQSQLYVHQGQQHQQHSHITSQSFSAEQQSPKGEHILRIPTLQLQVRLPGQQTISLPVRGAQAAHIKPLGLDNGIQESSLKTVIQQRQAANSVPGERQQRHTNGRNKLSNNLVGSEVRGFVDGAFDSGYLMTAQLNGQVFRGVLFPHCSAGGTEEANTASSIQSSGHATASPAQQPSVIIPATISHQSSSNGALIGYPVFPGVHFSNPAQTAAANRSCSSTEIHNSNKLSNNAATESNLHCNIRQNGTTVQVSTTGATRTNDIGASRANENGHSETVQMHTGPTQTQVETVGNVTMIAGQGGRWVWQPVVSPSTSYTIPLAYQTTPVVNGGESIQFLALPPFPGVTFAPGHIVNEIHPCMRANSFGTTVQAAQNSSRESNADLQAAVTLSLAAPGVSASTVSTQKS